MGGLAHVIAHAALWDLTGSWAQCALPAGGKRGTDMPIPLADCTPLHSLGILPVDIQACVILRMSRSRNACGTT